MIGSWILPVECLCLSKIVRNKRKIDERHAEQKSSSFVMKVRTFTVLKIKVSFKPGFNRTAPFKKMITSRIIMKCLIIGFLAPSLVTALFGKKQNRSATGYKPLVVFQARNSFACKCETKAYTCPEKKIVSHFACISIPSWRGRTISERDC